MKQQKGALCLESDAEGRDVPADLRQGSVHSAGIKSMDKVFLLSVVFSLINIEVQYRLRATWESMMYSDHDLD